MDAKEFETKYAGQRVIDGDAIGIVVGYHSSTVAVEQNSGLHFYFSANLVHPLTEGKQYKYRYPSSIRLVDVRPPENSCRHYRGTLDGYFHDGSSCRLVDDAPRPAQVVKAGDTVGRCTVLPSESNPAPPAKPREIQAHVSVDVRGLDAVKRLLAVYEDTLAHLHTVSAYIRTEKTFSAVHAEKVRRFRDAIADAKKGGG